MKKVEIIREIPFFASLREEDLKELVRICAVKGHVAGTALFRQGEASDSFFVIVAGEVEIRIHPGAGGPPRTIVLSDGDFFGEMGVMRNAPRSGDGIIKSDSVLLKIMKHDFDRLMAVNKYFSGMVMDSFLERSRQLLTARPASQALPVISPSSDNRPRGKVISVFSPCGGCGTTFLACNIASKLADFSKKRVLLVDMDLQFGTIELMKGVTPKKNCAELCQGIHIKSHDVMHYVIKGKSGVDILPRPRFPEQAELFVPDKVRTIIECAAREYEYVVVDMQSMMEEPNLTVLDLSDEVFMIITPEIPALSRMVAWLRLMDKLGFQKKRIRLILNKFREEGLISIKDIEKRVGQQLLGVIPYDYDTIVTSINTGQLVVEGKPFCPVSVGISNVARECLFAQQDDDDAEAKGEKPASFSLWGLFG